MLNKTGSSRMDTLLKIVLIFVMSVLSFSIGAFVGKQVSDTEYRQAMLESEHGIGRTTASVDPHSTNHNPEKALSEEDIASLTEEFVNVEKKSLEEEHGEIHPSEEALDSEPTKDSHGKKEHLEVQDNSYKKLNQKHSKTETNTAEHSEEAKKHSKKAPETSTAANRVSMNMAPEKDPAHKRSPTSLLPTTPASSIGKYTVQIASYATEPEAKKHALDLKAKGFSAFYIPADIRGQTWYRVSVGLFTNYNSAMAFRKELQTEANVQSSIIQKIVK
ncbi:MAG: SPOR domain-containing protein [Bdellovibrionaceae bacterium]|nr:SPOR domain-containing protein [Pseudobdellovibrionaceae bacterium]